MSLVIKFYFTSSMISMFQTLIHLSSGATTCYTDTTPNQPHRNSNTHRNKNTRPMWWYNRKVAGSWWWLY